MRFIFATLIASSVLFSTNGSFANTSEPRYLGDIVYNYIAGFAQRARAPESNAPAPSGQPGDDSFIDKEAHGIVAGQFKIIDGSTIVPAGDYPEGYISVHFRLQNANEQSYDFNDPQQIGIFERTLRDWAESILAKKNRNYLVSLDILDGNGNVQFSQPIFHFKYNEGFSYQNQFVSKNVNGTVGYPKLSNSKIKAVLNVRYSDETNAEETVKAIGDAAASAVTGGVVPTPISSLFDVTDIPTVQNRIKELSTVLGKFNTVQRFETITELSWKHSDDAVAGFVYHFRAPDEGDDHVLKLVVSLVFQESLLKVGSTSTPADLANVASRRIHKEDASFPILSDFVKSDPIFSERWGSRSVGTLPSICNAIKNAFGDRLSGWDKSLALEAFLSFESGQFAPHWNPDCYSEDDIIALKRLRASRNTTFAIPQHLQSNNRTAEDFETQIKVFLDSVTLLMKAKRADLSSDLSADAILNRRNIIAQRMQGGVISVVGAENVFGLGYLDEDYDASALFGGLIQEAANKAGCYSRKIFSTEDQPNVAGLLSENASGIWVHKIRFEDSKNQAGFIRPLSWKISKATGEIIKKFAEIHPDGCGRSSWKPRLNT